MQKHSRDHRNLTGAVIAQKPRHLPICFHGFWTDGSYEKISESSCPMIAVGIEIKVFAEQTESPYGFSN